MDGESKKDDGEMNGDVATASTANENKGKKQRRGIISRIQNLFGLQGDDFEKRLLHISKEEAAVLARIMKRSQYRRKITRNLIIFSVLLEVIAVGYAIMTTRSLELNWKMRALRVLPMFLLPGLSTITYSAFVSFTRICDGRDQRTLEKLRAERQAKINELKEKTNYYTTQQLIQKYDPDPAAKAAAATVLASKLGADSGLKVYLGDESKFNAFTAKSHDAEQSTGLRNRKKQLHMRSSSADSTVFHNSDEEMLQYLTSEGPEISKQNQLVVAHHHQTGSSTYDGGWIARIAALLVGEDPTQSYALICGKCHMHNGLARKEELPFITYYCPHCNALNRPKQLEEHVPGSDSPNMSSPTTMDDVSMINNVDGSMSDRTPADSSPVGSVEGNERIASDGSVD